MNVMLADKRKQTQIHDYDPMMRMVQKVADVYFMRVFLGNGMYSIRYKKCKKNSTHLTFFFLSKTKKTFVFCFCKSAFIHHFLYLYFIYIHMCV